MFSLKNPAIKFIFLIAFFIFFYIVLFKICVFFGVDEVELLMYMGWIAFLLILVTFLPFDYTILNIIPKPVAPPEATGAVGIGSG